jgi:hypothetical protein
MCYMLEERVVSGSHPWNDAVRATFHLFVLLPRSSSHRQDMLPLYVSIYTQMAWILIIFSMSLKHRRQSQGPHHHLIEDLGILKTLSEEALTMLRRHRPALTVDQASTSRPFRMKPAPPDLHAPHAHPLILDATHTSLR